VIELFKMHKMHNKIRGIVVLEISDRQKNLQRSAAGTCMYVGILVDGHNNVL